MKDYIKAKREALENEVTALQRAKEILRDIDSFRYEEGEDD